jgi:hypothetical protein
LFESIIFLFLYFHRFAYFFLFTSAVRLCTNANALNGYIIMQFRIVNVSFYSVALTTGSRRRRCTAFNH